MPDFVIYFAFCIIPSSSISSDGDRNMTKNNLFKKMDTNGVKQFTIVF